MLWIKALHVFFVVTWFAGLLYLPRLFVYHSLTNDDIGKARFRVMEKKLFIIMTIGAIGTAALGSWLLYAYAWSVYGGALGWLHVKLTLVAALAGYHVYCYRILIAFSRQEERHSHQFFRWINEVPAVILLVVLTLTIVKPF